MLSLVESSCQKGTGKWVPLYIPVGLHPGGTVGYARDLLPTRACNDLTRAKTRLDGDQYA